MTANNELVTVCVSTYNRKELLIYTIKSILLQSYKNFEIIIVDDCSTDGTKEFITNNIVNLDKRIRYIRHDKNKGLAAARNTAIYSAKGKYFTFCDDDDSWDRTFLEKFVEIAKSKDEHWCFTASLMSKSPRITAFEGTVTNFVFCGYTPPVASQFYFSSTLKKIGGYREEVKSGVDHDLWITLAKKDIMLLWLNKNLVKTNKRDDVNRITYNFKHRIKGINEAIEMWEEDLIHIYGDKFLYSFKANYKYNIYKRKITVSINKLNLFDVINSLIILPKGILIKDIIRFFNAHFSKMTIIKSPLFYHGNNKYCRKRIKINYNRH